MTQPILFLNGRITPAGRERLERLAPWHLKGKGVFETMRAERGKVLFLREHLQRLSRGLRRLGIKAPCSLSEIRGVLAKMLRQSRLSKARVRLTVWQEGRSRQVSVIVAAYRPCAPGQYRRGWKIAVCPRRLVAGKRDPAVKSIDHGFFHRASALAVRQDRDDALILNQRDELVECSRANLFFVKGRTLFTPSLACGCLRGITRAAVLKLARTLSLSCRQGRFHLADLLSAEEAFVTSSLIEVMPLTLVGDKRIGSGKRGRVTSNIMRKYRGLIN